MSVILRAEIDEFRIGKIKSLINEGIFTNEQEFLQTAIDEMIKKVKIKKLNGEMDKFAYLMAEKHKKSLSETVVAARKEEDERL